MSRLYYMYVSQKECYSFCKAHRVDNKYGKPLLIVAIKAAIFVNVHF